MSTFSCVPKNFLQVLWNQPHRFQRVCFKANKPVEANQVLLTRFREKLEKPFFRSGNPVSGNTAKSLQKQNQCHIRLQAHRWSGGVVCLISDTGYHLGRNTWKIGSKSACVCYAAQDLLTATPLLAPSRVYSV